MKPDPPESPNGFGGGSSTSPQPGSKIIRQAILVGAVLLVGVAAYMSRPKREIVATNMIGEPPEQLAVVQKVHPLPQPEVVPFASALVGPLEPPRSLSPPALPLLPETDAANLNPGEEEQIEAKYNEWLKGAEKDFQRMDPRVSDHVKAGMRKVIEKIVRDPAGARKEHDARVVEMQKPQVRRAFVPSEQIRGYFDTASVNSSPHAYVLGAFLASDPALLTEGKAKFPGNAVVLLGSLLYGETFLHDSDGLAQLASLDRETAWPDLLRARAALGAGDVGGASAHLQTALGKEIKPYESLFEGAWKTMSEHLDLPWARPGQTSAEEVFHSTSFDQIESILSAVIAYQKQHQDESSVRLSGAALALAERHSESPSLVGQRLALNREIELINAMGEAAKPYLSEPPEQVLADLRVRMQALKTEIRTVEDFKAKLSSDDLLDFSVLSRQIGEHAALEQMKAHVRPAGQE